MFRWSILPGVVLLAACTAAPRPSAGVDAVEIQANDNRTPAGRVAHDTLELHLEIGEGIWRPERAMPPYRVLAFAETGAPPITPGPLIRVREGMPVEVMLHNRIDEDVFVHGLQTIAGDTEPLRVPARGSAAVSFVATMPGTYYYWGSLGNTLATREGRDSQLTGALIVDPREGAGNDRIFVIGRLGSDADGVHVDGGLGAWVINGRSWPDTERLTYAVGERAEWRWINATGHRHPMHLHGTYFRVLSEGDETHDVPVPVNRQQSVVTEVLQPGTTMSIEWSPARPGNWLFHCHNLFHVMPENRLPIPQWYGEYARLPHDQHMAGLVLGIHAVSAHGTRASEEDSGLRRIAVRVGERAGVPYETAGLTAPRLGYSVDESPVTAPGPTISLERGRPVEVTIVNDIGHATAVHWHGIELESYYDGVPHWGGDAANTTPDIEPGQSFVARFTPPRAGTFIYHTHFNDYVQLTTGLYGALVVTEPGQPLSADVDHVFVFSQDGLDDQKDPMLLNGALEPPPMTLRAGRTHRLRFIGITASESVRIRLTREGILSTWTPRAKDGADLTALLRAPRPAEVEIFPGETYDFEFAADAPGELRLDAMLQQAAEQRASVALLVEP